MKKHGLVVSGIPSVLCSSLIQGQRATSEQAMKKVCGCECSGNPGLTSNMYSGYGRSMMSAEALQCPV